MKLITEEVSRVKFIVEGKGAKKKMYIEGVFLQGDIKNRNGRMYPVCNTLAKEVGIDTMNLLFRKVALLVNWDIQKDQQLTLDRVSHKITSLRSRGK